MLRVTQTGAGNALLVEDSASTDTSPFVITAAGDVGVGTTGPGARLDVSVSPAAAAAAGTRVTDGTRTNALYITGSAYSYNGAGANENLFYAAGGPLRFLADGQDIRFNAGTAERMRITSGGNVGIGTASPTAGVKLDVIDSGDAAFNVGSTGTVQSARVRIVARQTSVDDEWNIVATGAGLGSSALRFVKGTWTNTPAAVITSAGLVGIGTTSPTALLDVQSTTAGVRFPNMTTAQKNAIATPQAGTMVFDTTLSKLSVYSGAAWQTITSA
jgi:hypothetical protein